MVDDFVYHPISLDQCVHRDTTLAAACAIQRWRKNEFVFSDVLPRKGDQCRFMIEKPHYEKDKEKQFNVGEVEPVAVQRCTGYTSETSTIELMQMPQSSSPNG